MRRHEAHPRALLALALVLPAVVACSRAADQAPAGTIAIAPADAEIAPGTQLQFQVDSGDPNPVRWSVQESGGGVVDAAGLYTAPGGEGDFHVVATSDALSTEAVALVRVRYHAVHVAVTPSAATIAAGQSGSFVASVTGTGEKSVTWSVQEGDAGGIITAAGVYTAPATAGTYHVVATSTVAPAASGTATVTVPEPAPAPPPPPPTGIPSGAVDVTAYGAVGDGVHDDTAAFQAAAATGKVLWIPGTSAHYRITAQVNLTNGLLGDGSMPTIKRYGANGDWAGTLFYMDQVNGTATAPVVVSGVRLDGGWDATTTPGGEHSMLLVVKRSSYVEIRGNVMQYPKGDCIYIGNPSYTPLGVSDHVSVHDNKLWKPYRCAVAIISGTNGTISHNEITKTNSYVNAVDFEPNPNSVEYVQNWTVDGNWFNSTIRGANSAYVQSSLNPPSSGITLSNNHGTWPSTSTGFWWIVSGSQPITNVTLTNDVRDGTAPPAP